MNATVYTAEFKANIAMVSKLAGRKSGDAAWTFDDGPLTIEWAGTTTTTAGAGIGYGVIRVKDEDMRRLAHLLPKADILNMQVADGRLHLGKFSFNVEVQEPAPSAPIPQILPVNASLRDILMLPYQYDKATLRAACLLGTVESALSDRFRRTEQAAALLAPLGLSGDALAAWIETSLAAMARGGPEATARPPAEPVIIVEDKAGQVQMFGRRPPAG